MGVIHRLATEEARVSVGPIPHDPEVVGESFGVGVTVVSDGEA
jgi:hypothetical protein